MSPVFAGKSQTVYCECILRMIFEIVEWKIRGEELSDENIEDALWLFDLELLNGTQFMKFSLALHS